MSYKIKRTDDRIYVNMILQNNKLYDYTEIPVFNATFDYEVHEQILDDPENYQVAVESLTIPITNIPLWRPIIQPNLPPFNNTDVNKTMYSFTLVYKDGVNPDIESPQTYMNFIPQNPNIYKKPLNATNVRQDNYSSYYEIFTYSAIINMMNVCMKKASDDLNSLLPDDYESPYFTFDPVTSLISLITTRAIYDNEIKFDPPNLVPKIEIYCNYYMFELLLSLPQIYQASDTVATLNGKDVLLSVYNQHNNVISPSDLPSVDPGEYYEMKQNFSTLPSLSPIKSIAVFTRSIPISSEFSPNTPLNSFTNQGIMNKLKILHDFEPLQFTKVISGRNYIQYKSPKFSLIDMSGSTKLQHLDITLYWKDIYGQYHIIALNNNQPANVRIVFIRKGSMI